MQAQAHQSFPLPLLLAESSMDDKDMQRARTMHTLYTVEFDIAGGRWAGNERDGASLLDRFMQACDGFWNEIHNLILIHHTEMVVGEQRNSTATLKGSVI
jgi:hypothetical protein